MIFAGGRATRLGGARKALLPVGGRSIIERLLDAIGPLADEHLALVDDPSALPPLTAAGRVVRVIADPAPHAGPLPALAHGLREATGDVALLVAADMPFVSRDAFAHLLRLQRETKAAVVVPFVDGYIESMHAVVDRARCLVAADRGREAGERRVFRVLETLDPRLVDEAELRVVDPDLLTLFNVNTPEDLDRAARCWIP